MPFLLCVSGSIQHAARFRLAEHAARQAVLQLRQEQTGARIDQDRVESFEMFEEAAQADQLGVQRVSR